MLIYIGTILAGYFISCLSEKKKLISGKFFLFFLFLFLCFGYTTGSDWRNYELVYDKIDLSTLWTNLIFEPGYMLYTAIFKFFGVDFWVMWCFTKCIILGVFIHFLNKYNPVDRIGIATFFVGVFGFYLFIDNPMRNLIAVTFFLLSVDKFLCGKKKIAYIYILIAFSFHVTALVLPLYLMFLSKKHRFSSWVIIFVLFNFVFSSQDLLYRISSVIFGGIPYIEAKIYTYFFLKESDSKLISIGFLVNVVLFCMLLYNYKKIDDRYKIFCFNSAMLFVCLYRLTFVLDIAARFQYYLYLFYAIGLFQLCKMLTSSYRLMLYGLLFTMSIYFTLSKITKDSRYIPYTNYLVNLLSGEIMTYRERLIYNEQHIPDNGEKE